MAKPTLATAVTQQTPAAATTSAVVATNTTAVTPSAAILVAAAGDDDDDSSDDPDAANAEGSDPPPAATPAPRAGSLEAYKAVFGDVQGCVYFANEVAFEIACSQHIAEQAATITTLTASLEEQKKLNAELAKEVLGERNPIGTEPQGTKTALSDTDSVASFAASAESRMKK